MTGLRILAIILVNRFFEIFNFDDQSTSWMNKNISTISILNKIPATFNRSNNLKKILEIQYKKKEKYKYI